MNKNTQKSGRQIAEAWLSKNLRCAQQMMPSAPNAGAQTPTPQTSTPQAPAQTPTPLSSPQPTAPVSAQPAQQPPQAKTTQTPTTIHGCSVTFDHHHMVIEMQGKPSITLSLSSEQQAAVDARLAQKTPGTQTPVQKPPTTPAQTPTAQ